MRNFGLPAEADWREQQARADDIADALMEARRAIRRMEGNDLDLLAHCETLKTHGDACDMNTARLLEDVIRSEMNSARRGQRFVLAAIVMIGLVAWAGLAWSHSAPTGWVYDRMCCGGYDCAAAPDGAVTPTAEGYGIVLYPGEHPLVIAPMFALVPYDHPNIKPSQDQFYHVCIVSGTVRCLYVPAGS
jgi:hypothetical protein